MNSFKEEDENAQSIIINIECCQNCGLHSWFTHHQEEKYELYFNQMKLLIEKEIENVTVEKNLVPNNLIKLENRFNQEDINSYLDIILNKPVQYPRIGSFEITIFNVTIFSKITCSAWPHYGSIIYTVKNIIKEKIQNKIVIDYSVLKNEDQDNQSLRDSQLQNVKMINSQQYQSKKSSPSSPRAHNGIKIPPIQHSSRSNSPRMKNYLLPLEHKNDEIFQQPQIINSSFQKEKSLSPLKNLPPIIQQNDKKGNIKDQQKGYIVKTNFYRQQNQDEKFKPFANLRYQKMRAASPLQKEHNIYIRKTNLQGEEQNILIKSQNLTIDDTKEENSEIVKNMQINQERKGRDPQASSPVKVRFSNRNENEKSQERDQQTNNSSFLKPIQRKQEQDINSNSKNGEGLICDMKIKTVKLPYKTVYSNLKLANNKNQNSQSPKENQNSQSNQKNRLKINSNTKPTSIIQSQIEKSNETGLQQEEQSYENLEKLQISQNEELLNAEKQINYENSQEESQGNHPQKQANTNSSKAQISKEAQTGPNDLKKVKKSNQVSPIGNNKSHLNDTHKKVYSLEKTEKMYNEQENKKQNLTIGHNMKKNTISNLSKIELIKSDVNSSCSLFSNIEQKETIQQNLQINDDDDFSQKIQNAQRNDSQISKYQENTDYKKDTDTNQGQQEQNFQLSVQEVDSKNNGTINCQNEQKIISIKEDQLNISKEKEENRIKDQKELKKEIQNENLSPQEIIQIDQNEANLKNTEGNKKQEDALTEEENNQKKQIKNEINFQGQNTLTSEEQKACLKNQNLDKIKNNQIQETLIGKENKTTKVEETQQKHEDLSQSDQDCQQIQQEDQSVEKQSLIEDFEKQDNQEEDDVEKVQKQQNDGSMLSRQQYKKENEDQYDEDVQDEDKEEEKEYEDEYEEEFIECNQNIQKINEIVFKYLFKLEQKAINYIIQLQEQQMLESQQENYQQNISKLKENHLNFKQNTIQLENDIDQTTQIIKKSTFKQD
ncbi:hypothetical protein ABPG72_011251 [Tetrahymena utriculariae]